MKANILSIQRSGVQSGPGTRTTVYFKGCPLRCPWCSRPEAQPQPTELLWDHKKCFYGHLCEIHCPADSLTFKNDVLTFHPETCTGCLSCIEQCPSKALEFAGHIMELDEVMAEILEDTSLYRESGGGVTLTGGEVLNQPEFATELLKKCHGAGIHTLVETSGYGPSLHFSRMARHSDLMLFNLQHYDNKTHIRYTGVSQGKILENLDCAVSMKIPVIARIPVVPGVNSSHSDAEKFAQFLKEHQVTRVILLPLHQSGDKQYEKVDLAQLQDSSFLMLHKELREYYGILLNEGLDVSI